MAANRVKCEGESHANNGAGKEAGKHHLLLNVDLRGWHGHEVGGEADEGNHAQQVRPDVAGFCMNSKDGLETFPEIYVK